MTKVNYHSYVLIYNYLEIKDPKKTVDDDDDDFDEQMETLVAMRAASVN